MTREEAIEILKRKIRSVHPCDEPAYDMAIKALDRESNRGFWVEKPHVYGVVYCSECDFELGINNTNYCPNCGSRMIEQQESEE